jgi:hypothetical protein
MGNRAYIVFDIRYPGDKTPAKGSDAMPAVYLHWNGGPESVYAFIKYAKDVCRKGDAEYIPARFVQIVCNYFGSNLSVGLTATKREDIPELAKVGDNGVYVIETNNMHVYARHLEVYDNEAGEGEDKFSLKALSRKEIEDEKIEARAHKNAVELPEALAEVNDAFFRKEWDQEVVVTLKRRKKVA